MDDGEQFCLGCGAGLGHTRDGAAGHPEKDSGIREDRLMAALSYFGLLVFVPVFAAKESKFARYHANQGLVLFLAEAAYSIAAGIINTLALSISWRLYFVTYAINLAGLAFPIMSAVGIINAVNRQMKELPVIGGIRLLK